jgi:hypothetical protein
MSLIRLWRVLRRRRNDDAILMEEMSAHIHALEEEHRSRGLSAADARTSARRQFGNVTIVQEDVREHLTSVRSRGWLKIFVMRREPCERTQGSRQSRC